MAFEIMCLLIVPFTVQYLHVLYIINLESYSNDLAGCGSSIASVFAWHANGPKFNPHARHILSWRLGHEHISTAILSLPLIQEEQLSVTGARMCTKYSEACSLGMQAASSSIPTSGTSFRGDLVMETFLLPVSLFH